MMLFPYGRPVALRRNRGRAAAPARCEGMVGEGMVGEEMGSAGIYWGSPICVPRAPTLSICACQPVPVGACSDPCEVSTR